MLRQSAKAEETDDACQQNCRAKPAAAGAIWRRRAKLPRAKRDKAGEAEKRLIFASPIAGGEWPRFHRRTGRNENDFILPAAAMRNAAQAGIGINGG